MATKGHCGQGVEEFTNNIMGSRKDRFIDHFVREIGGEVEYSARDV